MKNHLSGGRLYRSKAWRIFLFREQSGRTNDTDTKEYDTFRYDTVEVENNHCC